VHERMAYSGKAYAAMGVNSNYAADSLGAVVKD
jgi:hypothetical protein